MLCYVATTAIITITTTIATTIVIITITTTTTIVISVVQALMLFPCLLLVLSSRHPALADSEKKTVRAAVFGVRELVGEGDPVTLSCLAPRDWILCAWRAPGGQKFCLLRLEGGQDVELCGNKTTPG